MAVVEGVFSLSGVLLALVLLLVLYVISAGERSSKSSLEPPEPPGPTPLPLLGNLLSLDLKKTHSSLCELARQYGPVFTVYLGPKKVVVLAGYRAVKEALVTQAEAFEDRDITPVFHDLNQGHGLIFSNGSNWRSMRRFSLAVLRDLGMGRSSSQQRILDEARHLLDTFSSYKGEPFDTSAPLNYAASNVISSIVYGTRFSLDDPYFTRMVQRANHNFKLSGSASMQVYNLFPAIGRWVRNREQLVRNSKENQLDMSSLIGRLRDSLNPADCRGFVDAFIMRQHTEQKAAGGSEPVFHEKNLVNCVSNLFSAGTDTTGTTLRWALLLMAKYPHIQERVHEELERVIGSRLPVADDRRLLPVTDAVLHETQRLANVFPMSLPHRTTQDVNIMGYRIKKGTSVFPLLASVLNDETEWEEPNRFHPEHFLDADGGFRKRDAFMPFSAGRRVCLGEALAKMELFLIFVSLLQRFRFTAPPGVSEEELDLTPVVGSTLNPPPHKLCALPRT